MTPSELIDTGFAVCAVAAPNPDGTCSCVRGAECPAPGKHPIGGKGWLKSALSRRERGYPRGLPGYVRLAPATSYGLVPPPGSGLVILDRDDETVLLPMEETFTVHRASAPEGRSHYYFKLADGIDESEIPRAFAGGEIRVAGNGHAVGPGSRHAKSGDIYEGNGSGVGIFDRELLDALKALPPVKRPTFANPAQAPEGSRHYFMVSEARKLRGWGWELDDIVDNLMESDAELFAGDTFVDAYGEKELRRIAEWAMANIEPDVAPEVHFVKTDGPSASAGATGRDPDPRDFPETAIVGVIGEVMRLFLPTTDGTPAAAWAGTAAYFSAFLGRDLYLTVGPARHSCAIYPVVVGPTASGKNVSMNVVRWLAGVCETPLTPLKKSSASTGEGITWALRDDREVWNVKDQVFDLLKGVEDKRLLLLQPEFGGFLRVCARDGNTLQDVVRSGWDGETLSVLVKGDGAGGYSATGAHLVILGNVTPDELSSMIGPVEEMSGFGNRFFYLAQERERVIPFPPGLGSDEGRVRGLVARAVTHAARRAKTGAYYLTPAAIELWEDEYPGLAVGPDPRAASMTDRTRPYAFRVALLYAALDEKADAIDEHHLAVGIAMAKFARATVSGFLVDKAPRDEARVLAALAGGPMPRARVSSEVFKRNRSKSQLDALRDALVAEGKVTITYEGSGTSVTEMWAAA